MEKLYHHLTAEERIELYRLHKAGQSIRSIAKQLGRSPSTLSRELKRNSTPTKVWPGGYEPQRAQQLTERRRHWDNRYKLTKNTNLQTQVHTLLHYGWSPEQIAGTLKHKYGHCVISHEAIYRFIYHRSAQKDYWHRLLPRRKSRRGQLGLRGGSPVLHIKDRVSIHERAIDVQDRQVPGHWEADLMLFSRYGQALLFTHERSSRLLLAYRQPNKAAAPVARQLIRQFQHLPHALSRSITFDNGTEFALHYQLNEQLGMNTYFCDPHAPWQKGGIENAIGRMRRYLPRKTDLGALKPSDLNRLIATYNHTPRKCLDYRTPAEVFCEQLKVLHFKRESTYPLSRV